MFKKIALAIITTTLGLIASWYIAKHFSNQAPDAKIEEPANNSVFGEGETITFRGSATDTEDKTISSYNYIWTSGQDNNIGIGKIVITNSLSIGLHNIFLQVFDKKGASGKDRITIEVIPKTEIDGPLDSNETALSHVAKDTQSFKQPEIKHTSTTEKLEDLKKTPPELNKISKIKKKQVSEGHSDNDISAIETNIAVKSDSPHLPEPIYDTSYSKILFAQRIDLNNSSMDSNYKNVRTNILSNLSRSIEYEEYQQQVVSVFSSEDAVRILKRKKCGKLVIIDIGLNVKEKSFPYHNMNGTFECVVDYCHFYIFTFSGEKRIHNVLKDIEIFSQTEDREKSVSRCFDKLVPIISQEIESILLQ